MASVAVLIKEGGGGGGGGTCVLLLTAISRFFEVFLVCAQGVLRWTHLAGPLYSSVARVARKPRVSVRANCAVQLGGERDSFLASESRDR